MIDLSVRKTLFTLLAFFQEVNPLIMRRFCARAKEEIQNIYMETDRNSIGLLREQGEILIEKAEDRVERISLPPSRREYLTPDFVYNVILSDIPEETRNILFGVCLEMLKEKK